MSFKINLQQQKLQVLYEREISIFLNKLQREKRLPSCSVSFSILSSKAESIKIYLMFANPEKSKYLKLINKNYSSLIKKHLASTKKFSRIPQITFYLDEHLETIEKLEKLSKNLNN